MKRKAAFAAAILSAAAMSFSACGNFAAGVYGPPSENFEDDYDQSDNADGGAPEDFEEITESSVTESGGEDTPQEKESDGQ